MTKLSERLRTLRGNNIRERQDLLSKLGELSDLNNRLTKATDASDATAVSAVLKDAESKGLRLDADDLGDSGVWASLSAIDEELKGIKSELEQWENKAKEKGIKRGEAQHEPSILDDNEASVEVNADFCRQLGKALLGLRSRCNEVSERLQAVLQVQEESGDKENRTASVVNELQQTARSLGAGVGALWEALLSHIGRQTQDLEDLEYAAANRSRELDFGPNTERLQDLHEYTELLREFSQNETGLSLSEDAMKAIGRYQTVKGAWNARAEDLVSKASPLSPMPWLQSHYLVCSVQIWNALKSIDNDKRFDLQIEGVMNKLRSCETSIRRQALADLRLQIQRQWEDALKISEAKWVQTPEDSKVFEELLFLQPPFPGTKRNPEFLTAFLKHQTEQIAELVSAKLRQEQLREEIGKLIRSVQDLPDEFAPQNWQGAWARLQEAKRLITDPVLAETGTLSDDISQAETLLETRLRQRLESLLQSDERIPGTDAALLEEWLRLTEEHQVLQETIDQLKQRVELLQQQSQSDMLQELIKGLQTASQEVQEQQALSDSTYNSIINLWLLTLDKLSQVSPQILEKIRQHSGQLTTKLDELDTAKSRKQVNELKQISNTIDSN